MIRIVLTVLFTLLICISTEAQITALLMGEDVVDNTPFIEKYSPDFAFSYILLDTARADTFCFRVRRGLDDAELDIGFANGHMDTTSLLTFAAGGDAFEVVRYDASGNGNHMTCTTLAGMPQIVFSGSLEYRGGNVASQVFPNSTFVMADSLAADTFTSIQVIETTVFNHKHNIFYGDGGNNSPLTFSAGAIGEIYLQGKQGNTLYYVDNNTMTSGKNMITSIWHPDFRNIRLDGTEILPVLGFSPFPRSGNNFGNYGTKTSTNNYYEYGIFFWESAKSIDIAVMESELNNYYGCY